MATVAAVVALGSAVAPVAAAAPSRSQATGNDLSRFVWKRSPADPPGSGNLDSLATNGKVFVVTGLAAAPAPGFVPIWTSTDGLEWTQAKGPKSAFPPNIAVALVIYAHGHFLAFGESLAARGVLAWTSSDGKHWKTYKAKHFPVAADNEPSGVVATKSGLLLQTLEGGQTYHLWAQRGDAWRDLGDLPGDPRAAVVGVVPGSGAAKYVAAGTGQSNVAAWNSKTGAEWTAASITGPNPEHYEAINEIVNGGPGFVAVGVVDSAADIEVANVWTSSNGTHWNTIDSPSFAATSQAAVGMDTATPLGRSVLAAGHDGGTLALWSSATGKTWNRAPMQPEFEAKTGSAVQAVGIVATKHRTVAVFRERTFDLSAGRYRLNGFGIVSGTARKK
jgi:hypothetical protein